ncbi:MAG: dihydrofolate reductase [Phycisphaeraceae bacterium]|nr:dihydrofolate reductase [Phycisphaeraceae bacterium]
MHLCLVAAMSENRVIGRDGELPWPPFGDLKRVRDLTMGHPIIMGRRTHESIGRVLPGRLNVILTRRRDYEVEGALVMHDLSAALDRLRPDHDRAFVFGGAEIYRQAMPHVDRIDLTILHRQVEGDTFLPEIPADFVETGRQRFEEPVAFSLVTLERRE